MMKMKKQVIQKQTKEISEEQNQKLTEHLASFTKNLEEFTKKYKDEIQFNPDFREQFYTMCLEIGVDPLASISLWSKALNLSEFYYNLAIQIITISMTKGPLIEINELRKILMNNMNDEELAFDRKIYDFENIDYSSEIQKWNNNKNNFKFNYFTSQEIRDTTINTNSNTILFSKIVFDI